MRKLLHVLTRHDDAFAAEIIALHREQPENKIEVVDLAAGDQDYSLLLEKIFQADSVQMW